MSDVVSEGGDGGGDDGGSSVGGGEGGGGVREVVTDQLVVSHVFVALRALPSYS